MACYETEEGVAISAPLTIAAVARTTDNATNQNLFSARSEGANSPQISHTATAFRLNAGGNLDTASIDRAPHAFIARHAGDASTQFAVSGMAEVTGDASAYYSTPNTAATALTGNIDLRWFGFLTDWTSSGGEQCFSSKYDSNTDISFAFSMNSSGALKILLSQDGTTSISRTATSSVNPSITDSAPQGVRVTVDITGEAIFYTSVDGFNWVQLGDAQAFDAISGIHNNASELVIGSIQKGGAWRATGGVMWAEFYDGIDGTLVARFDKRNMYREIADSVKRYPIWAPSGSKEGSNFYTSDFSAGADGWTATNGAVAGNIDSIAGFDDWLRFTCDTTDGFHNLVSPTSWLTVGDRYRITLDCYIPSSNSDLAAIMVYSGGTAIPGTAGDIVDDTDNIVSLTFDFHAIETHMRIYGNTGSGFSFQDAGGDDVFYVRNIVITHFASGEVWTGFGDCRLDRLGYDVILGDASKFREHDHGHVLMHGLGVRRS